MARNKFIRKLDAIYQSATTVTPAKPAKPAYVRPELKPFVAQTELESDLLYTFQQCRPHGTRTEQLYVTWLCGRIREAGYEPEFDTIGNVWVITDPDASTLFTSHTDTVHHDEGEQQIGYYREAGGDIMLMTMGKPDVLGADDGTGCIMMLEMVRRGVRGTFAWFRGEEVGCVGSKAFATSDLADYYLAGIERAVAFDRAGYADVINSQRSAQCCSDEFADALSMALTTALPDKDLLFAPSRGVYTDTAELTDKVRECTNLSIGYFSQHTSNERQNLTFVTTLIEALVALDWGALPIVREFPPKYKPTWSGQYGYYGSSTSAMDYDGGWSDRTEKPMTIDELFSTKKDEPSEDYDVDSHEAIVDSVIEDIKNLIEACGAYPLEGREFYTTAAIPWGSVLDLCDAIYNLDDNDAAVVEFATTNGLVYMDTDGTALMLNH